MKVSQFLFFGLLACGFFSRDACANALTNPGFELDGTMETQTIPAWMIYDLNNNSEYNPAVAHSGSNYFKVFQDFKGGVSYSGIYQDNITGPGAVFTADAWAYTSSSDQLAGDNIAWVEVTFRDTGGTILNLYRSALIGTNSITSGSFPANTWNHLSINVQYNPQTFQPIGTVSSLIAPPGTSFVRVQITFQGDPQGSPGSMYFDDLNLTQISGGPYGDWNLVWSDEFNATSINHNIWTYDTGSGLGNGDIGYYTSRTNNAYVADGLLHIVARQEQTNGYSYTSARLKTQGLFSATYGRIEIRAKLPQGLGYWPAFWMLGTDIGAVGWPGCGEIDIMENRGSDPTRVQGSLHSGSDETVVYMLPTGSTTNFHTYTIEWTTNAFNWFVDGLLYETQTYWASNVGPYPTPFNQPFFLIMNLAIGGDYLGYPSVSQINAGTVFPGEIQVDYVRIYNETQPLQMSVTQSNANALVLMWPTNIVCHLQLQTNSVSAGMTTNWIDATNAVPPYSAPLNGNGSAYFRLASP